MPETALSVAGLTQYLKDVLEEDPQLQQLWVVGDVTSVHHHVSGLFFTLSDSEGMASIKCVVWGSLRDRLIQMPKVGEQVCILGSVQLFTKRGEYQLRTLQILPMGEGLQALRANQLKARLAAEGFFDPARKRPLPPYPKRIAVVTSPTAAAWGDIQRTLEQRDPGVMVLFSPAIVQGDLAPASIAQALARVEQDNRAELIILARGGGAVEDLDCFNHERVVRAIALCQRPVITGIGHQRDECLADLVADLAAHTPTAAAERAVPPIAQLYHAHQNRKQALSRALAARFQQEQQHLQQLKQHLSQLPTRSQTLQQARTRLHLCQEKLAVLNPQAVLDRGYALARQDNGTLLRSPEEVTPGQILTVQLARGRITVQVIDNQG
ncbi:exodeoxyribonuclease VII large subunit [Spirulina subsalsa FACHB-351]|uniref:Exodeoxyribonuclease 7 large subunit n=1 Tax=Spirulina subsalsa FACHB-351 TaxID=234711 RepID=A0ABT3L5X5_9CYAN|nr:exodeoxyribonuclease VII large subunit [Spirulina subsalsa]MCW6036911.1 exodeoxyribonuclease VII large subunit [Spirulina subsalsa FACHB-351]